jgi:DUF1365 family protein
VSFYYCFDRAGERVEFLVGEVNNTPWGERHCYVLDRPRNLGSPSRLHFRFPKDFHVSPFMPMAQTYDWRFVAPGRRLTVHMENEEGGRRVFDATMVLARRELSGPVLAAALARHPLVTAKVVGAIYWNALRLWARGVPFFQHPGPPAAATEEKTP